MEIKWIGQSGYLLDDKTTRILIDPFLSDIVNRVSKRSRMVEPPFSPESFKGDAVICTHNHLDHLDPDAVSGFNKSMLFISPPSCKERLSGLGCQRIKTLSVGDSITVGSFTITAVSAFHTVEAIGLIVENNGVRMYFSSDTLFDERLFEIKKFEPDLMFICINGRLGNMNVDEAVRLTGIIGPRVGIPTHYGMFISNTEDPGKYISKVKRGFEMAFNKNYDINEILGGSV